jgi:hypothetical protein
MKDLVPVQLRKFLSRRYLLPGGRLMVAILYFPVEKAGGTDIRLVWDETSSGVNDSVFAPRFFMPSSGTLCRRVLNHAYPDFDVVEMFHNYMMDSPDVPYHGVNLPLELWEESGSKHALWGRLPMGFKASQYIACRNMPRALKWAALSPSERWS